MENKIRKEQSLAQKLAISVIAGTMLLVGITLTMVEPASIQKSGSFVWLHTIGMLLAMSSILVANEIKDKREFLSTMKNHWKAIVKIFFPN